MLGWYFEDFTPGAEVDTPARTVTESDVVAFAGLSGDYNPLHVDREYAAGTQWGEPIAHGLLGLTITSGLLHQVNIINGTIIAFMELEWRFTAPVKFGDTPRPDLILLDLNLPRKDGREVLAEIKADESLRSIPVIILTTSKSESDIATAYGLHANSYIAKPVSLKEFTGLLKGLQTYWLTMVELPR